tara:strand:+ start:1812 stop:2792 length:981 start_codon:yes stop_codon:yes gene_type:complete
MRILDYIVSIIIISTLGMLYNRYQKKYGLDDELKGNSLVNKYLLNDEMLFGKPNIWIHIDYEVNSRNWKSFNSRNSEELNKPYINVCIESIIKNNDNDFNIFLINDNSFEKLLPGFNVNIENLPNNLKKYVRRMGICKILYKYGGMKIPKSFLATKCLRDFYYEGISENKMFCVENINNTPSNFEKKFLADDIILGCNKYCNKMDKYCEYINEIITSRSMNEDIIKGTRRKWLEEEIKNYNINKIDGIFIGIKNQHRNYIRSEELLNVSGIKFHPEKYGIYINEEIMEKRNKLNWINRLSKEQLLKSDTQLGNEMLLCCGKGLKLK